MATNYHTLFLEFVVDYIKNRELENQKFNCLTAIKKTGTSHPKEGCYWTCRCDCGNTIIVSTQRLRSGCKRNCGCARNSSNNIVGKKINFLHVIERLKIGLYLCECECGKNLHVRTKDIMEGRIRSCGCKTKQLRWMGCGEISGTFWSRVKSGAEQRNIPLNLTIEEAWEVYVNQQGKCALTGIEINFASNSRGHRVGENTASLDRIDSRLPYSKSNIQWLHKDINKLKSDFDQSYLIKLCSWITNFQKGCNGKPDLYSR